MHLLRSYKRNLPRRYYQYQFLIEQSLLANRRTNSDLSPLQQSALVNDLGLLAKAAGDLVRAKVAFVHAQTLYSAASDPRKESVTERNLAEVETLTGRFPGAREHAARAVHLAEAGKDEVRQKDGLSFRASAHFALGEVAAAEADFARATELEGGTALQRSGRLASRMPAVSRRRGGSPQPDASQSADLPKPTLGR